MEEAIMKLGGLIFLKSVLLAMEDILKQAKTILDSRPQLNMLDAGELEEKVLKPQIENDPPESFPIILTTEEIHTFAALIFYQDCIIKILDVSQPEKSNTLANLVYHFASLLDLLKGMAIEKIEVPFNGISINVAVGPRDLNLPWPKEQPK